MKIVKLSKKLFLKIFQRIREKTRKTMAGFPTKVVESMSLGTPVITTDASDLADYIKHGENEFWSILRIILYWKENWRIFCISI